MSICILFCLFLVQLGDQNTTNTRVNRNLFTLVVSELHLSQDLPLQYGTLAATLIVLSNNISLNPGLATTLPPGTKKFQILHLNIHTLRYKLDELQLFCDIHKLQILAVNETCLYKGFNMKRDRNCFVEGDTVYVAEHLNFLKDSKEYQQIVTWRTLHRKMYTNGYLFSNGIPFTSRLKAI